MDKFDSVLLKPNIDPMDSNTQRIRRNLIVTSVIGYFFSFGSTGINSNSSFGGVKFDGLDTNSIRFLILFGLLNFIIHFIWATLDHFKENKYRLTGIAIPMISFSTSATSRHQLEPNTNDAKQSSIYSWWRNHRNLLEEYKKLLSSTEDSTKEINSIKRRIEDLENYFPYINESLKRFDLGFWEYQRSQLLRWIILDIGFPLIIGIISLILMLVQLLPLIIEWLCI